MKQENNSNQKDIDGNDILKYAISEGVIDYEALKKELELKQRQEILQGYNNKIWQGKNGNWYTLLYIDKETKKRKLVKKKYKKDLEDAIVDFYISKREYLTFKRVYLEWLNEKLKLNEINRTTYDRYSGEFKRFFEGTDLEFKSVDLITDDFMDAFIRTRIADLNLSGKAYGNMKTLIIGPLRYAKKRGYIEFSIGTFFADFDISKKVFSRGKKKKQVFKRGEVEVLREWLKSNPKLENYGILLTFETGLRSAELAALKFLDVDGDFITIQRQQIRYKSDKAKTMDKAIVNYTKTEAGMRQVVLTEEAKIIISMIREYSESDEFMFYKGGRVIDKTRFNEYLKRACNNCGIEPLSMHKIRKTYGTRLIDGGADDSIVQAQMGHTDIETTRKCYYDSDKEKEEIIKQVRNAISGTNE